MRNFQDHVSFIWSVADEVLRDDISRGKYKDVILPFTVLRRLDCVLAPTKAQVLALDAELARTGLQTRDGPLCNAAGFAFYKFQEKFGGAKPPWSWKSLPPLDPEPHVLAWVRSRQIAYAKAQARRSA